jgi:small basic protein
MGLVVGVVCLAAGCIGMAFGIVFNQTIPNDAALWLAAAAVAFGLTAHATR